MSEGMERKRFSRRLLLKYTLALTGAGATASLLGACANQPAAPAQAPAATQAPAAKEAPKPAATQAPAAQSAAGPTEIAIGENLPLSGTSASQGIQLRTGSEIAADEINAAGGIKALGGAKIKLVFADSKSTPDGGAAEEERLITTQNVAMILGCYQSNVTFPATEVAQRYKTPHLVNVAVKNEITERGYDYVFRDFNKASYDVREMIEGAKLFSEETGKAPTNVGFFYEGSDWGRSTHDYMAKLYPEAGYKVLFDEAYPSGQSTFSSQLVKIKAANLDMLVIAMYTPDHIIFSKELMGQKLYFPYGLWSVGAGSEDPTFYKAVPQAAVDYMFVQEDGDILANTRPYYARINDKAKPKLGYDLNTYVLAGYGTIWVAKDALERTKYDADIAKFRSNLRDALAATKITEADCKDKQTAGGKEYCPALVRGIQEVSFDKDGQNTHSHGQISENLGGVRVPLAPMAVRMEGKKPVWPVPPWDQR